MWYKRLWCWFNGHSWKTTATYWATFIGYGKGWVSGGYTTTECRVCGIDRFQEK